MPGPVIPFVQAAAQLAARAGPGGLKALRRARKTPFDLLMDLIQDRTPVPSEENPATVLPQGRELGGQTIPAGEEFEIRTRQREIERQNQLSAEATQPSPSVRPSFNARVALGQQEAEKAEKLERIRKFGPDSDNVVDLETRRPTQQTVELNEFAADKVPLAETYVQQRTDLRTVTPEVAGELQAAATSQVSGWVPDTLVVEEATGWVRQSFKGPDGGVLSNLTIDPENGAGVLDISDGLAITSIPVLDRTEALSILSELNIRDRGFPSTAELIEIKEVQKARMGITDPDDILF